MPSNHLVPCHPLLLLPSIFPSIRVFSNELVLHIRWPKYWSLSISPSNENSGLISFRMDWFDILAVQGTLKSLLVFSNSTVWKHQFFGAQSSLWSNSHICTLTSNSHITPSWVEPKVSVLSCKVQIKLTSREGNGNPLQYFFLENPMDRGAWWAAVHVVAKSQTWLSNFTLTFHFHALEKEMATHSSVLAWRIPGMAEPGRLPSMGSHRVRHNWYGSAAGAARWLHFWRSALMLQPI